MKLNPELVVNCLVAFGIFIMMEAVYNRMNKWRKRIFKVKRKVKQ